MPSRLKILYWGEKYCSLHIPLYPEIQHLSLDLAMSQSRTNPLSPQGKSASLSSILLHFRHAPFLITYDSDKPVQEDLVHDCVCH